MGTIHHIDFVCNMTKLPHIDSVNMGLVPHICAIWGTYPILTQSIWGSYPILTQCLPKQLYPILSSPILKKTIWG